LSNSTESCLEEKERYFIDPYETRRLGEQSYTSLLSKEGWLTGNRKQIGSRSLSLFSKRQMNTEALRAFLISNRVPQTIPNPDTSLLQGEFMEIIFFVVHMALNIFGFLSNRFKCHGWLSIVL
jgi:hypothetical protein